MGSNKADKQGVDLSAVCKMFFIQWRAVLLTAVIGGLLVAGLKYAAQYKKYQNEINGTIVAASESNAESLESQLSDDEKQTVEGLVAQYKRIRALMEYQENSLYSKIDPSNHQVVELIYQIHPNANESVSDIVPVFQAYLQSQDSLTKIAESLDATDDKYKYVSEIMKVSAGDGNELRESQENSSISLIENVASVKIELMIPEGSSADKAADVLKKIVNSFMNYNYGSFDVSSDYQVSLSYETINTEADNNILNTQSSTESTIRNQMSENNTAVEKLSDIQKRVYEAKVKEIIGTNGTQKIIVKPSISKKMLVGGFGLVIIVWLLGITIWMVLGPYVNEASGIGRQETIGIVFENKRKKSLLWDQHVAKLLYKNHDPATESKQILSRLYLMSGGIQTSNYQVLAIGFKNNDISFFDALIQKGKEEGTSILINRIASISDFKTLNKINDNQISLIALSADHTLKSEADLLCHFLSAKNVTTVGNIIVRE